MSKTKTVLTFLSLVVLLNVIRYVVGGPIESVTIMEPMHAVMPEYPEVFDTNFDTLDFTISLGYNFMMWLTATWVFHLTHPVFGGHVVVKSLKVFGLMCLFFVSQAAVYMNHYTDPVKPFYLFSMLDGVIVFTVVGIANGLLYPFFFEVGPSERQRPAD